MRESRDSLERKYLDRSGGHSGARDLMRVVGPLIMAVGAISSLVGFVSFFSGFSSGGGPPRYFWCVFVGFPLLGIGGAITKFAYMGAVARYMSNEIAPVGKDVVNYMVEGTQESVKAVTRAIAAGLRDGMVGEGATARCPKCGAGNQSGSKFCDQCGGPMLVACGGCGANNQPGSKFCDQCGGRLS